MKPFSLGALLVIAGLLIAGQGYGADSPYTIVRTPDLLGKQVKNAGGAVLGKVEDYVINLKDGAVVYAVLQHGDTLGFGGKLFAIPPQALSLAVDEKAVLLEVEKDDLDKALGFDANKWPTAADERWAKKGAPAKDQPKNEEAKKDDLRKDDRSREEDKAAHLRRVTSLINTPVKNTKGEDLGSTAGLVFNMKDNKVLYVAMSYGGVAGLGSKYFAIPWGALTLESPTLKAGDKAFVLDATKEQLDRAPGFDGKMWPTVADETFTKAGKKEPKP